MELARSTLLVGEGRLTGARQVNGQIRFFIDNEGMIVKRDMPAGSRGLTREHFISYADEYTETANMAVSLYGDELEIKALA